MTLPWTTPPAASFEFGLNDHMNCLAFFIVGGLHSSVSTSFGDRDAVRCSIVLLDGPNAGNEFVDVLVFNSRPVSRMRNAAGSIILARITQGVGRAGSNPPVEMADPSPQDGELAANWHSFYPNRLNELRQDVMTSWQTYEAKSQSGNGSRAQSQPHPSQAGARPQWTQPALPPPPAPVTQQAAPPPWQSSVVPGGPPATPEQAGF